MRALTRRSPRARSLRLIALAALLGSCTSTSPIRMPDAAKPASRPATGLVALVDAAAPTDDLLLTQFCDGALISPRVVLTVTHCVAGKAAKRIDVLVGAFNLCRTGPVGGARRHVTSILTSTDPSRMGLALLLLSGAVSQAPYTVSDAIGPYVALGWGSDVPNGPSSCTPREVRLGSAPNSTCSLAARTAGRAFSAQLELCLHPNPGMTRNTCTGDSGGPVTGVNQPTVLMALTDWGPSCAISAVGIYRRSSAVQNWIASVVAHSAS